MTIEIPATREKLREASFFLNCLEEEGRPLSPGDHFSAYLSAFLSAGRSVTFALQAEGDREYVREWVDDWGQKELSEEERGEFAFMVKQRNLALKARGAKHSVSRAPMSMSDYMQEVSHHGWQIWMHSGVPGNPAPQPTGKVHTFPGLDSRDVVSVCRKYLSRLQQLVDDYEKAH
jgi:hypothetical protein